MTSNCTQPAHEFAPTVDGAMRCRFCDAPWNGERRPATLEELNAAAASVVRIYSGRPGCGCGCNGNYSENKAAITRKLNLFRSRIGEVGVQSGLDGGLIFFIEEDGYTMAGQSPRYHWAYTG